MSGSAGTGGSNPRKFSEKIASHNQKQAEETRAFEQSMTDLTVSRVQFQKVQQLRLSQSRAQYYGGSLPNVNQIGNANADFQGGFPSGSDSVRGTRHHGSVERVHRDRNRINSPHRRPIDKHGRQMESSPYGPVYSSPPPDNSWRREQQPWTEEKRSGFRLLSQLNRTNSDSASHTSAMNPNPQDPFGMNQQMGRGPPQRNASVNEADVDGIGDVFSFPASSNEESSMGVGKPLPKQSWEAKKVQSSASRPKSCEVPGINIFPSPEQNPGSSHYQGSLSTGGSSPDLSNSQFPSPSSTPSDPEDGGGGYPNLSGGSSTGNSPAAMMHLGIGNSQGSSSSSSNPSIQASLNNCQSQSSLSNPSISSSSRSSGSSPRRRPAPISPLTLSPRAEQRRGSSKQSSPTMSPSSSPITQGVALDTSNMPREPPPPYPLYQQPQHAVDLGRTHQQASQHQQQQHQQQQQPVSPLQNIPSDFNSQQNSMASLFSNQFVEQQFSNCQNKTSPFQLDQFSSSENVLSSSAGGSCYNPSSSSLYYSQAAQSGSGGSHGSSQDPAHMRSNMSYSNCSGGVPNIILTDESNPSSSKDISSALSTVPECFDSEGGFPSEDESRIEPLSSDGSSMLSDPDMVSPDPSVEDTFRSDRL